MKKTLLLLLVATLGFLTPSVSFGANQMGAELTYSATAGNVLVVKLKFLRDCSGAAEPAILPLNLVSPGCNPGRMVTMSKVSNNGTGVTFCSAALNACTASSGNYQQFTYEATVTFSAAERACQDWILSVDFGGSNRQATANIVGTPTMYIEALVKFHNSNLISDGPEFQLFTPPVLILSQNSPITFSSAVYKYPIDSVAYSLIPALSAANTPVTYKPGYSYTNPTQSASGFMIDPLSGLITFTPPAFSSQSPEQNKYILAVKVDNWRKINGIVTNVGFIMREMMVSVRNTNNSNPGITLNTNNPIINGIIQAEALQPSTLHFTGTDNDQADVVQIDSDANNWIPGATFIRTTGSLHAATLSWTPTLGDVGKTYYFTVKVTDDACPLKGFQTRTYAIQAFYRPGLGIQGLKKDTEKFYAFPNPFQEEITFKISGRIARPQAIIIFNTLGQQVGRINLKENIIEGESINWRPSDLPAGLYTAKLITKDRSDTVIQFIKH